MIFIIGTDDTGLNIKQIARHFERVIKNPYHPSIYLRELLDDYKITPYRLAKDIFVPATRISEILKEKRGISIDTAVRLSKYFGNSKEQWLNIQQAYDLSKYQISDIEKIKQIA